MKAVISVISRDTTGIIAKVSGVLYENNINVLEISQSVLKDIFAMIMLVDISSSSIPFTTLVDKMDVLGKEAGMVIHTMHHDIFNAMHRI